MFTSVRPLLWILTAATLFVGLSANADFSGHYAGQRGKASDANGWDAPCTRAEIYLAETATTFVLLKSRFECGALSGEHQMIQLLKRDGSLFFQGVKVGIYSEREFDFKLPMEHLTNSYFVIRLVKDKQLVAFREDWLSLEPSQGKALNWVFGQETILQQLP